MKHPENSDKINLVFHVNPLLGRVPIAGLTSQGGEPTS